MGWPDQLCHTRETKKSKMFGGIVCIRVMNVEDIGERKRERARERPRAKVVRARGHPKNINRQRSDRSNKRSSQPKHYSARPKVRSNNSKTHKHQTGDMMGRSAPTSCPRMHLGPAI